MFIELTLTGVSAVEKDGRTPGRFLMRASMLATVVDVLNERGERLWTNVVFTTGWQHCVSETAAEVVSRAQMAEDEWRKPQMVAAQAVGDMVHEMKRM